MKQTSRRTQAFGRTQEVAAVNKRMQKLRVTGMAHRAKLIRAKLSVRKDLESALNDI